MEHNSRRGAELALATVLIVVALMTIYGTLELPAGSFDPLGSATIPQFVAGSIIAFSLWIAAQALAHRRATGSEEDRIEPEQQFRPRYALAVVLVLCATVYVAIMALDWVRFSIATLAFLLVTIGVLSGGNPRVLPIIVVVAVLFGFGLEYVFTQVFVIDLP